MLDVIKEVFRHPIHFCWVIFLKRKLSSCGRDFMVYGKPRILAPQRISIGNRVALNDGCLLNASHSSISIGDNVVISSDSKIIAASLDPRRFLLENDRNHVDHRVVIGNNVWICTGAIICPGVQISGGVVVAAGAVVTMDIVEPNVLVAGCPARVVRRFNRENVDNL